MVSLERSPDDIRAVGLDGQPTFMRIYKNYTFKLNGAEKLIVIVGFIIMTGLVTKSDVVEAHTWIIGFPIYSRYLNTLDTRNVSNPLIMQPLPDERDHC